MPNRCVCFIVYCTVDCTVYGTVCIQERPAAGAEFENKASPSDTMRLKKMLKKSCRNQFLQGYPFCWASLQNKRALKPLQNKVHFRGEAKQKCPINACAVLWTALCTALYAYMSGPPQAPNLKIQPRLEIPCF